LKVSTDYHNSEQRYLPYGVREAPPLVLAEVSPARETDPDSAKVAAIINTSLRRGQRVKVLEALYDAGDFGCTDYELSIACAILRTSSGKRRKELCEVNCAAYTDERRETDTATGAVVWKITGIGRKVIKSIREKQAT